MAEIKKQKVALTELLRNTIKSLRLTYKKNGVVLSKELGKGASYISQIESGKIKDIEYDMIHNIIQHITNLTDKEYDNFIKEYILNIIKNLSKKEYYSENWIHVYVLQDMPVDIPDKLLELIKSKMESTSFDSETLVREINKNNNFSSGVLSFMDYMENKLILTISKISNEQYSFLEIMYYKLPENYIEQILEKKISTISYIYMRGILRTLYKYDAVGVIVPRPYNVEKILFDYGFFHSEELFEQLNNKSQTQIPFNVESTNAENPIVFYDDVIVNYNKKYHALKKEALEKISYAFDQYKEENSAYACDVIEKITKNLDSDLGLIVSLLSSDLCDLHIPFKRAFWDEYKKLVQRFSKENIDS